MRSASPKLLGIGDNTVDVYVDRRCMFPGGNTVNVAAMWARLGYPSGYLGCLSLDRYGSLIFDSLADEGIDLSRIRRSQGPNACALIGHVNNDRRFLGSRRGVCRDIILEEGDLTYISGFDVVHTSIFSGLDVYVPSIAEHCSRSIISYDFANRSTDAHRRELARHLDVAFLSLGEVGRTEAATILRQVSDAGCRLVVGTRGGEGSMASFGGKLYSGGIKPAAITDTLGAGDGFAAGFLLEWCLSSNVEKALEAGAGNAADVCSVMGAFGHGVTFDVLPDDLPPRAEAART